MLIEGPLGWLVIGAVSIPVYLVLDRWTADLGRRWAARIDAWFHRDDAR